MPSQTEGEEKPKQWRAHFKPLITKSSFNKKNQAPFNDLMRNENIPEEKKIGVCDDAKDDTRYIEQSILADILNSAMRKKLILDPRRGRLAARDAVAVLLETPVYYRILGQKGEEIKKEFYITIYNEKQMKKQRLSFKDRMKRLELSNAKYRNDLAHVISKDDAKILEMREQLLEVDEGYALICNDEYENGKHVAEVSHKKLQKSVVKYNELADESSQMMVN